MRYKLTHENGHDFLRDQHYLIMSNAPEITKYYGFLKEVKGDVLITGLGIGFCVKELLKNDQVKMITVIEKEQGIIDLIEPTIKNEKVKVVQGDAWEIETKQTFDYFIHDIWMYRGTKTEEEIKKAKAKYKSIAKMHHSPFEKEPVI